MVIKAETQGIADELAQWRVDSIPVYATVTRPVKGGPLPAVCLVAGSGPTDRDWNSALLPGRMAAGAVI
jgi:hypothetical protein